MRSGSWAAGLLAAALSVACAESTQFPPTVAPPQVTTPPTAAVPISPGALPSSPATAPTDAPADASEAVESAITTLAQELGISEARIGLEEVLPVQWNDSSLGCPGAGGAYLQVITPGYLVTLSVDEDLYHVHTDLGGTAIICADEGEAVGEDTPLDPIAADFILQARDDLASRLDIPFGDILLLSSEAIEWPDSSLGCPEEGMDYAQVVVPGYLIVLVVDNQAYEYHSDYQQIILCTEAVTE